MRDRAELLGGLERPVVVAVIAVRVVEMALDEVVGVVAVRDGGMSTVVAVLVLGAVAAAVVAGCTGVGVVRVDGDPVLIGVALVGMVEVAVVEVVDVSFVDDGGVTAVGAVDVVVRFVCLVVAYRFLSGREHRHYIRTVVQMCRCVDIARVVP